MKFDRVLGQEYIKSHLKNSTEKGRVSHAQLFVGKEGVGLLPMALAYATHLICQSSSNPDSALLKCSKFVHPDMHFVFPTATTEATKSKKPISSLFLDSWREFITENPHRNLFEWMQFIGVEKKQGNISVHEAADIVKTLKLKSYEGGYKVMIIWMAEKMNNEAANKLLKLIEEPPEQTVFLLLTENEDLLLPTIKSRCQTLHFPLLTENDIIQGLTSAENLNLNVATAIAKQSNGNYNKALQLLQNNETEEEFENWFIQWVRAAFKAKNNASVLNSLIDWSDTIAKTSREKQTRFLHYCLDFFRQALLVNYKASELVYFKPSIGSFKLENFAPFVHSSNILAISKEINDAIYLIERNGNSKIVLLDLSIKLTRLLHVKETV